MNVSKNVASFMSKGRFEYEKMSPMAIGIYLFITFIILVALFANSMTFTPTLQFQCKNYVLNTYLYFLLAWSLSLMFVHIFDTLFTSKGQSLTSTPIFRNWIIIVVLFFVVFLLMMFFQKSFYLQHVFFILWVVLVGCILFMLFSKNRGLFYQAVGSAFAILLVFTIVAMKNPNLISPSVAVYLIMALVALIMARIIEIFLGIFNVIDTEQMRTSSRALSYIAILLFTLFIVYDTGVIQRDALRCNSTTNPPNYISSSTGIFLDTLNLATNIFNIQD